jgi:hypothetical protein
MEHDKIAQFDRKEALRRTGGMYFQQQPDKELVEKYAALIMTPIVIKGAYYLPTKQKKD